MKPERIATAALLLVFSIAPFAIAEPPPAASEDKVMKPTKEGIRLTPDMARAFSAHWLSRHIREDITLTESERLKLSEAAAERLMKLARQHQQNGSELIEFAIENLMNSRGKFTPEMSVEFSQRLTPLIPSFREFTDGVSQDAGKVLPAEKATQVRDRLQRVQKAIDILAGTMDRWSQGQFHEGERPFIDSYQEANRAADAQEKPAQTAPARPPAMRRATRIAEYEMNQVGPASWKTILDGAKRLFGFTPEQSAKADKLLADYTVKAEAVMTPAWREKVRQNRIRNGLQYNLPKEGVGPWLFHLQQEYAELIKPVQDLGTAFRLDLLGLATDEQRSAVLEQVRKAAADLGVTEPIDSTMLGLPTR